MVDEHADDVAEGFGVPRMVIHFVDFFGRCRCRRHLGHLLDARLTYRTTENVCLRLGLRTHLCYVAVLGGYQQSQQQISMKMGGEWNDRPSLACCLSAAFQAARFARIADRFGDSTLFHHPVKVDFECNIHHMT
jgi:hypothetical protein